MIDAVIDALRMAGTMAWQICWSLILGFLLAAVVQAVVRREQVSDLLGDDRPSTLARATGLGVASSSCSYAAVALARSLFRKGASFTAAMVFELASTNLVIELGIILALLLGWQFTLAEFVGGPIIIVLVALAFRIMLRENMIRDARAQADKGLAGSMEGHAGMDMSIGGHGSIWSRLASRRGVTSVSHIFVMEWAAVVRDILIGLLIAGAIAAWVPVSFWQHLFLNGHPVLSAIWGPIIGPIIAIASFVCSIGNVPLAAVLWNGGISFGGVTSFLFADLLILPILAIYRKYYGWAMTLRITGVFYVCMVLAGYAVEAIFQILHLVPAAGHAFVGHAGVSWNYTTWLNIAFLVLAGLLCTRFIRTGGIGMLHMMGGNPTSGTTTAEHHHDGEEPAGSSDPGRLE
ncbi:permease [Flexivirga caeni]|uniref:Permease n=1 Tax=Flexivirga caeni TaxID=2294115 RepID=A0A3M9LXD1_9MICO|nr:permease [Flexivirga caeni]RNI17970.1 permease [Flexivirga caeni]